MQMNAPELFLDDEIIQRTFRLGRSVQRVHKYGAGPLIAADRAWESSLLAAYGTVMDDPERELLRFWYNSYDRRPGRTRTLVCYAESEDGLQWHKPVLEAAEVDGSRRNNVVLDASAGPIERGENLLIYYSGRSSGHGTRWPRACGALGLGVVRRDGFCAIEAGPTEGELVTKPLQWPGGALWVNADLRPRVHVDRGKLRVEVLGRNEEVIPGLSRDEAEPLAGDLNYGMCSWRERSDLSDLKGRRVSLRFLLREGRLYSFKAALPEGQG